MNAHILFNAEKNVFAAFFLYFLVILHALFFRLMSPTMRIIVYLFSRLMSPTMRITVYLETH